MSDDRPKKSWRELDRAKDRGSSGSPRRRDEAERNRERASKSAAYSQYKSKLDGLFKPGGTDLPEHMKAALGPSSEKGKAQKELTEALMRSPGKETLQAYLDAGLVLPENPRLLTQLLDTREDGLTQAVLSRLRELVDGSKKPNRMLLLQRLTSIENWSDDDDTLALVRDLRSELDG